VETAGVRRPPDVSLVPFDEALLSVVQPWFEHPEVRRRLGGPEWPVRELRLMARTDPEEFRGLTVLRMHSWVAFDDHDRPVGKVGGDVYDRWARYDGSDPDRPVVSEIEPGPAMGLALVVDPARWGQGCGRAMLRAVLAHPDVADVVLFALGIDEDNTPSRRCARAAGFRPDDAVPDWEGTVYHLLRRRSGQPGSGIDPSRASTGTSTGTVAG
jgi:RimJ/RimL family protein N-acetyltransferase